MSKDSLSRWGRAAAAGVPGPGDEDAGSLEEDAPLGPEEEVDAAFADAGPVDATAVLDDDEAGAALPGAEVVAGEVAMAERVSPQ